MFEFDYYLHDEYNRYEFAEFLNEEAGIPLDVAEAIANTRPFYEVTLKCRWNPDTETVEVLEVKL
jgi:hypothetical protein